VITNPLTTFEGAELGREVCEGCIHVTQTEIDTFCNLLGYNDPAYKGDAVGGAIAPSSMGLTYGLRLGWENKVFPPGCIRMGDENVHGHPVRPGDDLRTVLTIVDKFKRKNRKFMKYKLRTTNQRDQLVCSITFTAIVP
jgi:acyl dehydratase|tara:strand:- start:1020 stop:1436 length:417 start_codon:yes stop_codon:yes gene_type:complete